MARYINQTKSDYYKELQKVRDDADWEAWIIYLLQGVTLTAKHTTVLIERMGDLLLKMKAQIRKEHKFYSQDLMNNLFSHPYTKVAFLEKDLGVSRATATRYLDALAKKGILQKHKLGRESYYINFMLADLLFNMPELKKEY